MKTLAALILSTLWESPNNEAISGHIYAAIMNRYSLDQYDSLLGALIKSGLISRDGMHVLKLEPKGNDLAKQCSEAFANSVRQ